MAEKLIIEERLEELVRLRQQLNDVRREVTRIRQRDVEGTVSRWINRHEGDVDQLQIDQRVHEVTERWNEIRPSLAQLIDGGRA